MVGWVSVKLPAFRPIKQKLYSARFWPLFRPNRWYRTKNSDGTWSRTTSTKSTIPTTLPSGSGLQSIKVNYTPGSSLNKEIDGEQDDDENNVSSTSSSSITRALVPYKIPNKSSITSPSNDNKTYFGSNYNR